MSNYREPIKALIADDDPISLMILDSLVRDLGIETLTATDVASAKTVLSYLVPQIAILDVILPDGDGVDILHAIRAAKLPTAVALISATLGDFPFHKCGSNQPDIIFSKPLDGKAITAWIIKQAKHAEERAEKVQL